ncbi:alpha/beta fold hydrolase [Actinokineospora enzanensis]|uniref:alpha/beta fold hydrolase n=1 Tax=Actinokineospora enzanensis TaxID=155975 RepID=UPI00037D9BCA|nr:alpha/beta hydrolase [Actinokineospora enzanensis]
MEVRSADGTTIAFDRVGSGPPVVFVSGAVQYRAIDPVGAELAGRLADRFTVITYDRRGRGESGDDGPYAVEREVEDLAALLASTGPARVFGESSGAVLALEAAARGLPITALVGYEPPFVVSGQALPDDFAARFDALIADDRRADAFRLFMIEAAGLPPEAADGIADDPMWPLLRPVTHTIAYDREIMGDTQRGDVAALSRFAGITVPTLVLDGGDSPADQREVTQALMEVLPNARGRTVPGQNHRFTADLAPVLAEFLG